MKLLPGTAEDFEVYYKLKCEPSSIYWGGFTSQPDYYNLKKNFESIVNDADSSKKIYFLWEDNEAKGYVQALILEKEIELSIGVLEETRGKGIGTILVREVLNCFSNCVISAYIREDNIASKKCFEHNGFKQTQQYKDVFFPMDNRQLKMFRYERI